MSVVAADNRGRRAAARRRPPTGSPAPLVVRGLTKSFGAARALANVDLRVDAGAVVALVGPNGSGKTTLLRSAAGLVAVDAGEIRVAGSPAGSRPARAATAFVPDEPTGFDELGVTEFVTLVHALWEADEEAIHRAQALAVAFGLDARRNHRLGTLSRGLRKQASIVAALSLAPSLILIDEATATLDPEAVVVLREAVAVLAARGCGVLLGTQDLHFAGSAAHEVVLLDRGVVVDRGAPDALRTRHGASSLEDVFLASLGDGRFRERVSDALGAL